MNPIISPWSIYLINVLSGLKNIFIVAAAAAILVGIGNAIYFLIVIDSPYYNEDDEKDQNKILNIKKCFKKSVVGLIISALLVVIAPSKDTMYTMLALDNLTTDNIQAIGKTGKDVIDYVSDQIDKIVNGNQSNNVEENEK
ncbi:hypothetical protein DW846_01540 [Ruminococcus sp. AM36-2AA]|nr:hypothetical protein DW851_01535 [Ruminococcus sp. AM36-5]RGH62317.1 hypothetical protein DW846_01540 [Ruminococcus sp. AM36-2AA]